MSDNTIEQVEALVLPFLQQLLLGKAVKVISTMVATDETRFPGDTLAALTTQVDGDLAHKVRVALGPWLGWIVDAGWNDTQLQSALTALIEAAIEAYPVNPVVVTAEIAPPTGE